MNKNLKLRLLVLFLGAYLRFTVAYEAAKTEVMMAETAQRLIDSLDKFQLPDTVFKFDTPGPHQLALLSRGRIYARVRLCT